MQEPEPTPDPVEDDAELSALEADLDTVDAALAALDADDLDRAEALAASLTDAEAAPAPADTPEPPAASD